MQVATKIGLLSLVLTAVLAVGGLQAQTKPAAPPELRDATNAQPNPPTQAPPAAAAPESAPADQTGQPAGKPGFFQGPGFLMVMLGGFFLLYIWMGRGRRKQEAKRKEMLSNLKKGDKITSIGGIVGTVIEVRDDEVIVKVDENNNVRMRFARWAIRGVGEEAKTEKPEDRKP